MVPILWFGMACAVVALVFSARVYVQHRRQAKLLPAYAVGALSGNAATICLLGAMFPGLETLAKFLLFAAMVFLVISTTLSVIAWRRRRTYEVR